MRTEAEKERARKRYQAHREERLQKMRDYYQSHKKEMNERQKRKMQKPENRDKYQLLCANCNKIKQYENN
jgi:hypothetical protein